MKQHLRRDRPAPRLKHTLTNRRRAHYTRSVAVPSDEMRNSVEPLSIPGQDAGPHLVALVGPDFALEGAFDGGEFDGEAAFVAGFEEVGIAVLVAGLVDADGEEGAEEVGAGDVEVGVVCAV